MGSRAYASPEEMLNDSRKRFGNVPIWILPKDDTCARWLITGFDADGDVWLGEYCCTLEELRDSYMYEDGSAVGVLEEKDGR